MLILFMAARLNVPRAIRALEPNGASGSQGWFFGRGNLCFGDCGAEQAFGNRRLSFGLIPTLAARNGNIANGECYSCVSYSTWIACATNGKSDKYIDGQWWLKVAERKASYAARMARWRARERIWCLPFVKMFDLGKETMNIK